MTFLSLSVIDIKIANTNTSFLEVWYNCLYNDFFRFFFRAVLITLILVTKV